MPIRVPSETKRNKRNTSCFSRICNVVQANIPAFWSWANPNDRPEWDRAVNVDMIMNMEIMLWSGANGGGNYDDNVVRYLISFC